MVALPASSWLFDVDGTLVDSNYLHVAAWATAFHSVGRSVQAWRIHRDIGMDSTKLLQDLLGDDAEQCGPDAQDAHKKAYSEMTHLLRPLPGSRDLIDFLSEQGAAVVLATSAPPEELKVLRKVLDVDELLTAVTDSDDVETAKPEPGIVRIAVDRSGRSADNAVFVGDAIWDMHAAGRAGVGRIGLLTGGISEGELRAAGADQVFADAAALLESLRGKGAV